MLRPLLTEEKNALREHLKREGLLSALIVDQHGDLLDGHHREDLCRELGIDVRFITVETDEPINWINNFQKARRNLNREEMRQLIAQQIIAAPHLPNTSIAKVVGVSDHTVKAVRSKLIAKGKVSNVVQLRSDGRVSGAKPSCSQVANTDSPKPPQAVDTWNAEMDGKALTKIISDVKKGLFDPKFPA